MKQGPGAQVGWKPQVEKNTTFPITPWHKYEITQTDLGTATDKI